MIFTLSAVGWRWTRPLNRRLLLLFGAPWLAIHAVLAVLAETRLLLVPIVLSLIPAAIAITDAKMADEDSSQRIT